MLHSRQMIKLCLQEEYMFELLINIISWAKQRIFILRSNSPSAKSDFLR